MNFLQRNFEDVDWNRNRWNRWLDKLASPAAILTYSIVASIVLILGTWLQFFPTTEYEKNYDVHEAGLVFQNSRLIFAANIAILFSSISAIFDQILNYLTRFVCQAKFSAPAENLADGGRDIFVKKTFLKERFTVIITTVTLASTILVFMQPGRDPATLVRIIASSARVISIVFMGASLAIIRQSSKFCTKELTIFIWITLILNVAGTILYPRFVMLNMMLGLLLFLTILYPLVLSVIENSCKDNHDVESNFPSDDFVNAKEVFEKRVGTIYLLMSFVMAFYLMFTKVILYMMAHSENYDFQERQCSKIFFCIAVFIPISNELWNPMRLYNRWQEEKIQLLYTHSMQLLEGLLPDKVIAHFKQSKEQFVESFDCVTIIFADIMDYTVVCQLLTPYQIVLLLGDLFCQFDEAAKIRGVYRVETVGDCYMASTGCPDAEDPSVAAERMVQYAQDLIQIVRNFKSPFVGFPLQIRIGIHSGPVVAGTLSGKMPRYCLFGDTVNTASRMESTGEVDRIHLSEDTVSLVKKDINFSERHLFLPRLPLYVKGKGVMSTYFLDTPENMATMVSIDSHHDNSKSIITNLEPLLSSMPFDLIARNNTNHHQLCPSRRIMPDAAVYMARDSDPDHDPNPSSDPDSIAVRARARAGSNPAPYCNLQLSSKPGLTRSPSLKKLVVPINEHAELHMDACEADPQPNAHVSMAFVVASSLLSWDFDVQNVVSKDMLINIAFTLFKTSWLCGPLGISEITLRNFIENVAGFYHHHRSFHNFQHAISVLHITSLLTNYCNQKHMMGHGTLSLLSRFALMVGALVHDCDHPGHTNSFEVNTDSALAQKYGNIGVLEHHHLAVAESILAEPGCNILETFDEETTAHFKDLIIYMVLGTDMSLHKEIVSEIETFSHELDPTSSLIVHTNTFTLCRAILHAADLSNPVRASDISKAWAILFYFYFILTSCCTYLSLLLYDCSI